MVLEDGSTMEIPSTIPAATWQQGAARVVAAAPQHGHPVIQVQVDSPWSQTSTRYRQVMKESGWAPSGHIEGAGWSETWHFKDDGSALCTITEKLADGRSAVRIEVHGQQTP
jgi:hypothetical protein